MAFTQIEDGTNGAWRAKVDSNNRLHTRAVTSTELSNAVLEGEAYNVSTGTITLTSGNESAVGYFEYTGDSSGSNAMNINGATTPTDFYVKASTDYDIYIKAISFELADAGAALNEFGNLAPLTNGVEFCWVTTSNGNYVLDEGLKTNWDIVRLCGGNPAFGTGTSSFRANNVSGASEGFIPVFDTQILFGMPWGLRLKKNTLDKLVFRVQDNISSVDSFNIIAYGTRI